MSEIKKEMLMRDGQPFYPITHESSVMFDDGKNLTEKLKEAGSGGGGVKTINGDKPDANGNINVAVMTPEQQQKVEQAIGMADELTALKRDYGQYEDLPDVSLTPETSGQYIDENGKYVTAEGWAVASIGEVTMGNKYELDMKSADNMVLGVAVFVSRVRVYNASGDVIKTTLTPLFSAKNTNVPKSGYLVLNAYDTYTDVLVCYKPALTTSLKVRRYGDTASTATQLRNLRQAVDLKSFADGYYAGMRVGTADNLAARGEEYPVEFGGSRQAGGSVEIEEGTADVKSIKGKTIVFNQLVKNGNFDNGTTDWALNGNVGVTVTDGVCSIKKINTSALGLIRQSSSCIAGHKYLVISRFKVIGGRCAPLFFQKGTEDYISPIPYKTNTEFETHSAIFTASLDYETQEIRCTYLSDSSEQVEAQVDYVKLFDLTQMFGAGNEPATAEEFAERLGYSSVDEIPYFEYNEGELRNNDVASVKCTGANLFDGKAEVGSIKTDGEAGTNTNYKHTDYIKVKGGEKYFILNTPHGTSAAIAFYDVSKNVISTESFSSVATTRVVTTPLNCSYMRCSIIAGEETKFCINKYDESYNGTYEPYTESVRALPTKKYFPDGLRSADDVYDEMTPTKAITRIGGVEFDGTEKWNKNSSANAAFYCLAIKDGAQNNKTISSYYKVEVGRYNNMNNKTLGRNSSAPYSNYVFVRDDDYATVSDWKQHLADLKAAGTPLTVYYELAEPIEEEYDELNLSYNVHPLGIESVTFNNSDGKPNVYKASHVYSMDAYNTIVSNRKRIEALEQALANIANTANLQNVE